MVHIANAAGALLTVPVSAKPVGRLTWNNPPNSKAAVLCDVTP